MKQSDDNKFIPMTSVDAGSGVEVAPDVYYYTNQIVNVIMIGSPGGDWVLIDAGMPKSGEKILKAAEARFGEGSKPACIILTHGHFDHVGGITYLLEQWKVPVYADIREFPFLNGSTAYPEPDPSVQGGVLAKMAGIYPHQPTNIASHLHSLPHDGRMPVFHEWRCVETPGHSPGHTSFFRERDGLLISGDAIVTVRQDAFYKVLMQSRELHGPPRYFTTDWAAAKKSVEVLNSLNPETIIAGHGQYMSGPELKTQLNELAFRFDELALPDYGKYVP